MQLLERVLDWRSEDVVVDQEERLVRNVALAGIDSRNGYRYSEEALKGAVSLYLEKPVFLDHAEQSGQPRNRSAKDLVGTIVNARYEEGRIRGDIQVLDTESGRTFFAFAERETPGVGMSHVVLARRSADGSVVEAIEDVVSVDAVVFPATTTSLRESVEEGSSSNFLECDRDRWKLIAEQREAELLLLREESSRQELVDAMLEESDLPEYAKTATFVATLRLLDEEVDRGALVADRLQVIRKAVRQNPGSRGRVTEERLLGDGQFLKVLKR